MTKTTNRRAVMRPPLAELENEVMQAVWKIEPCSVEAVHAIVSRKHNLKETSVRSILRRLEQKSYLTHESDGTAYIDHSISFDRNVAKPSDPRCSAAYRPVLTGIFRGTRDRHGGRQCPGFARRTHGSRGHAECAHGNGNVSAHAINAYLAKLGVRIEHLKAPLERWSSLRKTQQEIYALDVAKSGQAEATRGCLELRHMF